MTSPFVTIGTNSNRKRLDEISLIDLLQNSLAKGLKGFDESLFFKVLSTAINTADFK